MDIVTNNLMCGQRRRVMPHENCGTLISLVMKENGIDPHPHAGYQDYPN